MRIMALTGLACRSLSDHNMDLFSVVLNCITKQVTHRKNNL